MTVTARSGLVPDALSTIDPTPFIDAAIRRINATGRSRFGAVVTLSLLGDMCSEMKCHYLDLPSPLGDIALRDHATSRDELLDGLLRFRATPLVGWAA